MEHHEIAQTHTSALEVLPPSTVRRLLGDISAATEWRMRQRDDFPRPVRLSPGRIGYRRCDVEAFIAARLGGR